MGERFTYSLGSGQFNAIQVFLSVDMTFEVFERIQSDGANITLAFNVGDRSNVGSGLKMFEIMLLSWTVDLARCARFTTS